VSVGRSGRLEKEQRTDVKPNIQQAMKQVQRAQAEMARVQEELAGETVEASAGGGMVRVTMSGDFQVRSVTIDPQSLDPDDVGMLEDMVAAAVNEAVRAAQELASAKMSKVMGGMGLPGGVPGMF
jgi:DNA-binding YbaB/EbfC family protein